MTSTGNVTQNEINVTLSAQQAFEGAVGQIQKIIGDVLDAGSNLSTSAMVTTAGSKFGSAVQQWVESATDIVKTLEWMAGQLGNTAKQLQAGNQQSEDMAAGLPSPGNFGPGF